MTPTQRAAAERLAFEQWYDAQPEGRINPWDVWQAAALLRELAAEPVQEPVAYVDPRQLARGCASLHCITKPEYRSYADAQAGLEYTPVYLHPPQQRKPLSIEKIVAIANSCLAASDDDCAQNQTTIFARAIEKAVLENITGEPT
jgi:hypothetical protein